MMMAAICSDVDQSEVQCFPNRCTLPGISMVPWVTPGLLGLQKPQRRYRPESKASEWPVTPGKLEDLILTASPGQSYCTHAGFCSGIDHSDLINVGYRYRQLGDLGFQFGKYTIGGSSVPLSFTADDYSKRAPKSWGPNWNVVNESVPIFIIQISAFGFLYKNRGATYGLKGTNGRVYPPGMTFWADWKRALLLWYRIVIVIGGWLNFGPKIWCCFQFCFPEQGVVNQLYIFLK